MFILLLLFFLLLAEPTHAYLDPGSGSMLIQIIIGAFLGGGLIIKAYWQKIFKFIRKLFSPKNAQKKESE
jgi:hypothetical protein